MQGQDEVDSVDAVFLPESAIDESEVDELEGLLESQGVGMLVAGVRQRSPQAGQLRGNWVHLGVSPRFEKGASLPSSTREQWYHVRQNKQNRWLLDEKQIYQYHLGGALHPQIRSLDATDVPRRAVQFVEPADGVTLAFLICEDLAQINNVAEVVRSVGPTVVYPPVLDGPQLSTRWAARYASVLADDPGSADIYNSGKVIALVCHSPGVLRHVKYKGEPLVKGKHVTGFTDGEEAEVQLTHVVPFLVEDELLRLGAIFEKVRIGGPFSVVDGRLVTGQNPASSTGTAQALLKLVGQKAAAAS